jgi:cell division protein FtsB
MKEVWKNPDRWKRRLPALIAVALAAAALLVSLFRDMGVIGMVRLRGTEQQLRSEVEALRLENTRLKREVDGLRSNPAVIEEEARKLGLIQQREKVIVVPQKQDAPARQPAKPGAVRP